MRQGSKLERVGLVVNRLSLGGSEKQVVLLAKGLHERGVRVSVATLLEGGQREKDLRDAGIDVCSAGFRRLDGDLSSFTTIPAGLTRYMRWLRRERPQVVHAFLYHSYLLTPAAARVAGIPVVVAGRRSLGHWKEGNRPALAVERLATRMTDLLIANSEAVAADAIRQEGVRPGKVVVVHNGLPPEAFLGPRDGDQESPIVLCVANLIPYKGHRHLLDAVALLTERGLRFTLMLVGEGPARPALEQQAAGTGGDVRFLGARTDVGPLYQRCDVAVLPSLEEGLSNSVLEAMAAGKPVVATAVGGNAEAVGDAGVLVPPASPEALADALGALLCDPARRSRLGQLARERAASRFSADAMVERHIELYESLLRSRCAASPAR